VSTGRLNKTFWVATALPKSMSWSGLSVLPVTMMFAGYIYTEKRNTVDKVSIGA
jgi:hypothetical protein